MAMEVAGVQAVESELDIAFEESDKKLGENVAKEILRYVFFTIYDDVNIGVEEGIVTLTGRVTWPFKATEIAERVSRVLGVQELRSEIQVLPVNSGPRHKRGRGDQVDDGTRNEFGKGSHNLLGEVNATFLRSRHPKIARGKSPEQHKNGGFPMSYTVRLFTILLGVLMTATLTFASAKVSVTIVLESGDERSGRWIREDRDFVRDFRHVFGRSPEMVTALALIVDTDDTGARATAWFDDLQVDHQE